MKVQSTVKKKTLPDVDREDVKSISQSVAFDTRKEEQKEESVASGLKLDKSLKLTEDTAPILVELTKLSGLSERAILGKLANEALESMKKKIEMAKELNMVPNISIK